MGNEEVKIIYCYDKNKEPIHYLKTIKGELYYCVDCGAELIIKEGNRKIKHLAHKNLLTCGGTGESIFHKHWKENLFKEGMYINLAKEDKTEESAEILNVLNEVSLKDRYNMNNWNSDIIVDILLETTLGDVVIEIFYTNSKDWLELEKYYSKIKDLQYVYELKVSKYINEPLKWINAKQSMIQLVEKHNKKEQEKIENSKPITYKCFLNFASKPIEITNSIYQITCMVSTPTKNIGINKIEIVFLQFDLNKLNITIDKLKEDFNINSGFYYIKIETTKKLGLLTSRNNLIHVTKYSQLFKATYDKDIYKKLCNINKGGLLY
jgi:hypothetical protein